MKTNAGIVGTGIYIPENYMTAKEISEATVGIWSEKAISEKLGIRKKFLPGKDDGTEEMGVKAALNCLKNTGVDPKEIDVILCIGEEWKEYPLTTSALYIQNAIGAVNAWGIDLQNRCSSTVSAIKIAKDMLVSDDSITTIMIVGGYRNGDLVDYTDKNMSIMYDLSAGGGALLLKKNYGKNIILGSHIIADASLSKAISVDTKPLSTANISDIYNTYRSLRLVDPVGMNNKLSEISIPNWYKCISMAFEKSGLAKEKLDYLAILHLKPSAHNAILRNLQLTEAQSIYLEDYGHMGQIDQILSLHLALQQGKVRDGSIISMVAAGIGYVWAANVIKWGKE